MLRQSKQDTYWAMTPKIDPSSYHKSHDWVTTVIDASLRQLFEDEHEF
jgi:hypothetical protein